MPDLGPNERLVAAGGWSGRDRTNLGRKEDQTRAEEEDCSGDRRDIYQKCGLGRRDWEMATKRALLGVGGSWRGHGLWESHMELEGGVIGRRDARECLIETRSEIWRGG